MFELGLIIWLLSMNLFQAQDTGQRKVNMSLSVYLKFEITKFQIFCANKSSPYCNGPGRVFKVYLKMCGLQPSNSKNQLGVWIDRIFKLTQDINKTSCGSYDNSDIFNKIDGDTNFFCGPTVAEVSSNFDGVFFKFEKNTVEFVSRRWIGNIVAMFIVASMDADCVNMTVLSTINALRIPTFSNQSKELPNEIALQTMGYFDASRPISSQMFINNPPINLNRSANVDASVLYFNMEAHCPQNYYLRGCWYHCTESTRNKCDPVNGSQICAPGWLKTSVTYVNNYKTFISGFETYTVGECTYYDPCINSNCLDICIPLNNGSYSCLDSLFQFDPPNLILLPGDTVRCSLDNSIVTPDKKIEITWRYVPGSYFDISVSNLGIKDDTLFVLTRATPSYNNIVACIARDMAKDKTMKEIRNYTILKYPTMVRLNVEMQHVYLGDYITCSSNAWPPEHFNYSFDIPTKNFILDRDEINNKTIHIPDNAILGEMLLNCSVEFFDLNGTTATFYRLFRIYIYAMRLFKWSYFRKSWYWDNETFRLLINVSLKHSVQVLQISGPSVIETLSDNVVRFNEGCRGGTYRFLANLYLSISSQYISFHQRLDATLFEAPSIIQFSNIIGYPNERIQCFIDGNPQDIIDSIFMLKENNNKTVLSTKNRMLRIPVNGKLNTIYHITCEYNMIIYNTTYADFLQDSIVLKVRPEPYQLTFHDLHIPLIIITMIFVYFYSQYLLTVYVLSNLTIICYGTRHNFIYKTFCLYNKYRKNVRYDEIMNNMTAVILDVQQNNKPGEKIKMSTFYDYLNKTFRASFSQGYISVPSEFKPISATVQSVDIGKDRLFEEEAPLKSFYGIGPTPINIYK